ncbi:hypothetical protein C0J27_00930 [Candidatus Chromulinivorax destructor]|uniref:beta-glucosidase n=2 Tax=Candidatus Chromulinivorax destructor TaxID=2066483 RepID=A0A345ZAJ9_9BACT|nr:hypothetical protein C0J27_00930 [Candidatus Chromulinivorax destructor]
MVYSIDNNAANYKKVIMKHQSLKKSLLILLCALITQSRVQSSDRHSATQTVIMTAIVGATAYTAYSYVHAPVTPTIKIKNVAQEKLNFPSDFAWGVSTSSTQCEQTNHNNCWSRSYLDTIESKKNTIAPNHACNSWTHWKDDIDKAIHLGCTSYRISFEWSRIQPTEGTLDQDAINHYVEIAKYCQKNNIQLMCCLHHYSDPIWFMHKGGFAKAENITLFTDYCQKMYEALQAYVHQWIVISQPVAYALKGYKVGMQPPFLKDSGLETTVMLNMFNAHIAVYDILHNAFKNNSIGKKPEVGLCHQIVQMKAASSFNPLEQLVATFADRLSNQTLLRTFTDGHFQSLMPMVDIAYLPDAPDKFDFFALSYYSPLAFTGITPNGPACDEQCASRDAFRIIDKEGMYDAIVQASKLGKPIYIVENGINPKNEEQRELLLNSYLSAISQAIADGYNVRGYMHWTLMNNYEWCYIDEQGNINQNNPDFGLYHNRIINDTTGQLHADHANHDAMLKQSGKYYKNIIAMQK